MTLKNKISALIIACFMFAIISCGPSHGNKTGHEFMPDMGHSTAYEANTLSYYYYNTWGSEADYKAMAMPRRPVAGTIPRGSAGATFHVTDDGNAMSIPVNGSVPYYYDNTDEDRSRAARELINNPYPITNEGLASAKSLYIINCGICHGDKGDGAGYLVRPEEEGGKYPAAPANFLTEAFVDTTNGIYYHAIMHGKNVMGKYSDKLSYEERWQVIHYIRSLQAKSLDKKYDENMNTLNNVDVPFASIASTLPAIDKDVDHGSNEGHGTHTDDHGHEGGGHDGHGNESEIHNQDDHDHDGKKDDGHDHDGHDHDHDK